MMKEKIKIGLFFISIFYSFVVIVLMICSFNSAVTSIELNDSDENISIINEYKMKLTTLEDNSCTFLINDFIEYYEKTSYNQHINLREFLEDENNNSVLDFYEKAKNSCNLSEEDIDYYNFPTKFIASAIQLDELLHTYYFQYEIGFDDKTMRNIIIPNLSRYEYTIRKSLQVDIIGDLIEIASKEVRVNE